MDNLLPLPDKDYKVFVRCNTYNHKNFIMDSLAGFVMQRTEFPFCVMVIDDASTDGQQSVIKSFVEQECMEDSVLIYDNEILLSYVASHKSNTNCTIVVVFLKSNHWQYGKSMVPYYQPWRDHCEYEALCEGDDFWVDALKLQKQVSFMDSHTDYGMIHTDFDLTEGTRNHRLVREKEDDIYFPSVVTEGLYVGPCTALIRLSFLQKCPQYYIIQRWPMYDFPMWIELAYISKIKYLKDVTAKYRVLPNSASHSEDIYKMIEFKNAGVKIKQFYANHYQIKLTNLYNNYYYESIVRFACRLGNLSVAKEYFNKAIQEKALNWKTVLFYICAKYPFLKRILEIYRKV